MEVDCESKYPFTYLYISITVHFFGITSFCTGIILCLYFDITLEEQDFFHRFAYSFKYITMFNAVTQLIYYVIALIVDIMVCSSYTLDAPPKWLNLRSFIRSAISTPFGLYTCVTFWVLSAYDLNLIGDYGSRWLTHTLYTSNLVISLLDVLFCKGESADLVLTLIVINVPSVGYFLWLHIIYYFTGVWPVSFMKNLTLLERLLVYLINVLVAYLCFLIGKLVTDFLWNEEFIIRIPYLRKFLPEPPRFIYGHPSLDSSKFGKLLSRTEGMYVDRPSKKRDMTAEQNIGSKS